MPGLIGPEDVRTVAQAALDLPGADGVEVLFFHQWGGLTRFASSSMHQSTWSEDTGVRVRVVTEGRVGVAASNDFTKDGARKAAASALERDQHASICVSMISSRRIRVRSFSRSFGSSVLTLSSLHWRIWRTRSPTIATIWTMRSILKFSIPRNWKRIRFGNAAIARSCRATLMRVSPNCTN